MVETDFILTRLWSPPVPIVLNRPGYYLAIGQRELPIWALSALCPALAEGGQVYWIDAANRFDAYGLSRTAQSLNLSPRLILSRVQLSRPFTAMQLEALVSRTLPKLSHSFPVILADPLAPFYDSELQEEDAQRTFPRFLAGLENLSMTVLALAVKREPPPTRRHFSLQLAKGAKAVAHLDIDHGAWHLETWHPQRPALRDK